MRDSESVLMTVGLCVFGGFGYFAGRIHERGAKDSEVMVGVLVLMLTVVALGGLFCGARWLLAAARKQQQAAGGDGGPEPRRSA